MISQNDFNHCHKEQVFLRSYTPISQQLELTVELHWILQLNKHFQLWLSDFVSLRHLVTFIGYRWLFCLLSLRRKQFLSPMQERMMCTLATVLTTLEASCAISEHMLTVETTKADFIVCCEIGCVIWVFVLKVGHWYNLCFCLHIGQGLSPIALVLCLLADEKLFEVVPLDFTVCKSVLVLPKDVALCILSCASTRSCNQRFKWMRVGWERCAFLCAKTRPLSDSEEVC